LRPVCGYSIGILAFGRCAKAVGLGRVLRMASVGIMHILERQVPIWTFNELDISIRLPEDGFYL
jgi:hypothetical protein